MADERSQKALVAVGTWLNTVSALLIAYILINAAAEAAIKPGSVFALITTRTATLVILSLLGLSLVCGFTYLLMVGLRASPRPAVKGVIAYLLLTAEGGILALQAVFILASFAYLTVSKENVMAPRILEYLKAAGPPEGRGPARTPPSAGMDEVVRAVRQVEHRIQALTETVGSFKEDFRRGEYGREIARVRQLLETMQQSLEEVKGEIGTTGRMLGKNIEAGIGEIEGQIRRIEQAIRDVGRIADQSENVSRINEKLTDLRQAVESLKPAVEDLRLERSPIRER